MMDIKIHTALGFNKISTVLDYVANARQTRSDEIDTALLQYIELLLYIEAEVLNIKRDAKDPKRDLNRKLSELNSERDFITEQEYEIRKLQIEGTYKETKTDFLRTAKKNFTENMKNLGQSDRAIRDYLTHIRLLFPNLFKFPNTH